MGNAGFKETELANDGNSFIFYYNKTSDEFKIIEHRLVDGTEIYMSDHVMLAFGDLGDFMIFENPHNIAWSSHGDLNNFKFYGQCPPLPGDPDNIIVT